MSNFIDKVKKEVAIRFAPSEVSDERINICNNCDNYNQPVGICKKCGCFMPAKSKLARAKCPLGKWQPI